MVPPGRDRRTPSMDRDGRHRASDGRRFDQSRGSSILRASRRGLDTNAADTAARLADRADRRRRQHVGAAARAQSVFDPDPIDRAEGPRNAARTPAPSPAARDPPARAVSERRRVGTRDLGHYRSQPLLLRQDPTRSGSLRRDLSRHPATRTEARPRWAPGWPQPAATSAVRASIAARRPDHGRRLRPMHRARARSALPTGAGNTLARRAGSIGARRCGRASRHRRRRQIPQPRGRRAPRRPPAGRRDEAAARRVRTTDRTIRPRVDARALRHRQLRRATRRGRA